jgi:ferredoxin
MTYVIVETCIGVKDRACGACEPECPVTAIFPEEDVPPQYVAFIEKNKEVFNSEPPPGRPKR